MIVEFAPQHREFVLSSFANGAGEPQAKLEALLDSGEARCLVYTGSDADLYFGWAAVATDNPQVVIWAYVKWYPEGVFRNRGLMKRLLAALGTDVTKPLVALYPSPACRAFIASGWPITIAGKPDERNESPKEART